MKAPEFSEMGLGLGDEPPAPEPKPPVQEAPVAQEAPPPADEEAPANELDDEFHQDPLIQKAIEKFKARLVNP